MPSFLPSCIFFFFGHRLPRRPVWIFQEVQLTTLVLYQYFNKVLNKAIPNKSRLKSLYKKVIVPATLSNTETLSKGPFHYN